MPIPGSPSPHSLAVELTLAPEPADISLDDIINGQQKKISSLSIAPATPGFS
jgi:hypothetical protein